MVECLILERVPKEAPVAHHPPPGGSQEAAEPWRWSFHNALSVASLPHENRARGSFALRRRLAAVDLRSHRDRRRAGRLGRMQRQPQSARTRRLCQGYGAPARRPGSAARRAALLGHAARDAAESGRRHAQGHRRRRACAVGHQSQGAGRAGVRVVRRPVARSHPAVLVALRDHARAHVADGRYAAAANATTISPRWARRSWRAASPRSRPTS